jgi:hypothetical protein
MKLDAERRWRHPRFPHPSRGNHCKTSNLDRASRSCPTPEKHQAVVEIVQSILAGKNGMRH